METWKRAQNLQVATRDEGALIGRLDDFQFDLESHRIYGWRLKGAGMFGKVGGFPAESLLLIGRDIALIRAEADVEVEKARVGAEGRAWASAYRGTQAISRRGTALGAVQDYVLAPDGSRVTGLLLHGHRLLALEGRVQTGPAAVIVESPEALVELPEDTSDEHTDWWLKLKGAVGPRRPPTEGSEG